MRRYLFAVLFLVPMLAQAELTFEQLDELSMSPENLTGDFKQEKYLSSLDASLASSGVFNYQRETSIRWQTLLPIQNELLMTPTAIVNSQGGKELVRLETDSNPAVTVFSEILFSVLTAEWGKLASYFELSGGVEGVQWVAQLVPIDKTVMPVVSRVELKGDVLLREVILHEASGDRTTIRFDNLNQ